jgi:hypothetical protein
MTPLTLLLMNIDLQPKHAKIAGLFRQDHRRHILALGQKHRHEVEGWHGIHPV